MADNEKVGGIAVELEVVLDQASLTRIESQLARWASGLSAKTRVGAGPAPRGGNAAGSGPIPVTLDPAALKQAGKAAGPIPISIRLDAKNIADQIQAALSSRTFIIKLKTGQLEAFPSGGGGGKRRKTGAREADVEDEVPTGIRYLPRGSATPRQIAGFPYSIGASSSRGRTWLAPRKAEEESWARYDRALAATRLPSNPLSHPLWAGAGFGMPQPPRNISPRMAVAAPTPKIDTHEALAKKMLAGGASPEEVYNYLRGSARRGGAGVDAARASALSGHVPSPTLAAAGGAVKPPKPPSLGPLPGGGDLDPEIEKILNAAKARQTKASRAAPMRALSTAVVQMFENALGGVDAINNANARMVRERTELEKRGRELDRVLGKPEEPAARRRFEEQQQSFNQIPDITMRQRGKFLAAGAAGAVAGGVIGGATALVAFQALQFAISAASAALGPLVDQMTGFSMTTSKVANAMRDAIRGANGNVGGGLAGGSIASGISATFLDQLTASGLGQGATGRAAAQARAEQSNLFRSRNASGPNPLFSGTGGLLGTNLFAEQMGGQPGLFERVADDLMNSTRVGAQGGGFGQSFQITHSPTTDTYRYLVELNRQLDLAADSSGRLASEFEFTTKATKEETEAMMASARATGDEAAYQRASIFRDAGIAIRQRGGGGLGEGGFTAAAQQLAAGQLVQDPELYFRQQQRGMIAQLQAGRKGAAFNRGTLIPMQLAAQLGMRPGTFGSATAGMSAAEQRQFAPDVAQIQGAKIMGQARMFGGASRGAAMLGQFGGNAQQYMQLNTQIAGYSKHIADIQDQLSNKQMAFGMQQYNIQLAQANRSLADAEAMTGKRVKDDGTNLGILERQTFELNKQSQQLSLQATALSLRQQQRQINFQVAVAGFSAPGLSGAERYARVRFAKQEAAEAQKQLNIQKEQLALQRRIVGLGAAQFERSAKRAVIEARNQRDLLVAARELSREEFVKGKLVEAIQTQIEPLAAIRDSLVDEAVNNYKTIMAAATEAAALFGTSVDDMFDDISKRYSGFLKNSSEGIVRVVSTILNGYITAVINAFGGAGGTSGGGSGYLGGGGGKARGAVGMTGGTTSMIMGEAGTEAYAILRNPRKMAVSAFGGGGGSVTININNPTVRDDGDLEKIAKEVERVLNRRSAILGFRRPA